MCFIQSNIFINDWLGCCFGHYYIDIWLLGLYDLKYWVLLSIFFRLYWPHQTCEWPGSQWKSRGRCHRDSFDPPSSASWSIIWVSLTISSSLYIFCNSYHTSFGCYSGLVMKLCLWDEAAICFGENFKATGGTARVILLTTLNPKRLGFGGS